MLTNVDDVTTLTTYKSCLHLDLALHGDVDTYQLNHKDKIIEIVGGGGSNQKYYFYIMKQSLTQSFQVAPPDSFVFTKPNEWPKWIRHFERYQLASGLDGKPDALQVNALVYAMGDEADDIMAGFGLTEEEREVYQTERTKFNCRCPEEGENVDSYITSLFYLAEHCEYGPFKMK